MSTSTYEIIGYASCVAGFLSASAFSFGLLNCISSKRKEEFGSLIESDRVKKLRQNDLFFRAFEPLIIELLPLFPSPHSTRATKLQEALDGIDSDVQWRSREFLATRFVEACAFGIAIGLGVGLVFWMPVGIIVGVAFTALVYPLTSSIPVSKFELAKRQFVRRLPFAVDLMVLMMESGAQYRDSLKALVEEESDHEIGFYFGRVLREMDNGIQPKVAIKQLQKTLGNDDDVREFVFAIVNGEELGVPIAKILRTQSDQMKLKRTQRAEKEAAAAEVKMTGPGFAIMIVCMIVVAAPFAMNVMKAMQNGAFL